MPTIKERIEALGYVVVEGNRTLTPRQRLLGQANSMLEKLAKMKSTTELDSKTTNQNWWSGQAQDDQRRVVMRYGGAIVNETAVYVDDTLEAVTKVITDFKGIIEATTDADWVDEVERRKKKAKDAQATESS